MASAREKSIRHGHPSTLHLWWSRKPLATCRAVLFAQLVDDPSSWPNRFPTEEEQDSERRRLHRIIERIVPWEAASDESVLNAARWEIARSIAWGLGEEPPERRDHEAIIEYLQFKAPPVYDPFSGGGSIPLEAQRLGLRAYGADLNPVAVLIGKALVEIPPKFANLPPVNPEAQAQLKKGGSWNGTGARGLAEDVRYYGRWMRDEAEKRIGHFYPKAKLSDGSRATVIAWLWARTVRSPDPQAKGAMVPLVSSYLLSSNRAKKAWIEPAIDPNACDGYYFTVKSGNLTKDDEKRLLGGNMSGRATFRCLLTGTPITGDFIDREAQAGRLGARLLAVVAEGQRSRLYLSPTPEHEVAAKKAAEHVALHREAMNLPDQESRGTFASNAQGRRYCFSKFSDYFSQRQLIALTTFSDLVREVEAKIGHELSGKSSPPNYEIAVATYLALAVDRLADRQSTIASWDSSRDTIRNTFARQAIAMTWTYAEGNIFSTSSGSFESLLDGVIESVSALPAIGFGSVSAVDARRNSVCPVGAVISTDPPYYDNVIYADLSDFFYVWLRRSLGQLEGTLFRRLLTPKDEELVVIPHRHGGREGADLFFLEGMTDAVRVIERVAGEDPIAIYYAFKQSEIEQDGIFSPGWSSFLQALVDAGIAVDGTWPVRTELMNRVSALQANSLASSIVLVCRKRAADAKVISRADFLRLLKHEFPNAIDDIRRRA